MWNLIWFPVPERERSVWGEGKPTYIIPETYCRQGDVTEIDWFCHCPAFESVENDCSQANVADDNRHDDSDRYSAFHSVPDIVEFVIVIIFMIVFFVAQSLFGCLWPIRIHRCWANIITGLGETRASWLSVLLLLATTIPGIGSTSEAKAMQQSRIHKTKDITENGTDARQTEQKDRNANQWITNTSDLSFPSERRSRWFVVRFRLSARLTTMSEWYVRSRWLPLWRSWRARQMEIPNRMNSNNSVPCNDNHSDDHRFPWWNSLCSLARNSAGQCRLHSREECSCTSSPKDWKWRHSPILPIDKTKQSERSLPDERTLTVALLTVLQLDVLLE